MIPRASLKAVSFTLQGMGPILHNGSGEVNDLKKLITELEEMQCVGISERLREKTLNSSMASCWKRESTSIFQYESVGGSSGKRHSYTLIFCMISLSEQVTVQGFPSLARGNLR